MRLSEVWLLWYWKSFQCVSRILSFLDNKDLSLFRRVTHRTRCSFLFRPVFLLCLPPTHSACNNKSTSDNGAPKQRCWNAVTTGRPLALFTHTGVTAHWLHLHADFVRSFGRAVRWMCALGCLLGDVMNRGCWLWHTSTRDIHYSVASCCSAPVTVMSTCTHRALWRF